MIDVTDLFVDVEIALLGDTSFSDIIFECKYGTH